jgi:hypothetical protein
VAAVAAVTHPADPRPVGRLLAGLHLAAPRPADLLLVGAAAPHLTRRVALPPAARRRAGQRRADLPRVVPGEVMDRADLRPADPLDRVGLEDRAIPVDRAAREHTSRVDLVGRAAPEPRVVRVNPAGRERTVRVDLVGRAALVDLAIRVDPAGLVARAGRERTVRVDRRLLVHRADHHRRRIDPAVPTTEAARNGAVPTTRRTASADPATVRHHHPRNAGLAGMMVLRPVGHRRTGTARHLRVAGMAPRLQVGGTVTGTGRRAT